jgi:hypothetical protein
VRLGDVVDQLHDEHSLADAGAAEEADLAALLVRRKQVDDLRKNSTRGISRWLARGTRRGSCTRGRDVAADAARGWRGAAGCAKAERRERALMPVTRISSSVLCSLNGGASRWIGRNEVVSAPGAAR